MLQQPGSYLLPAIDVGWWNIGKEKVERAHLEAVMFDVAANPDLPVAAGQRGSRLDWDGIVDFVWQHWLLTVIAAAALGAAAWGAPRAMGAIVSRYRTRREAWLRSEAWSFHQFRRAAGRGDAKAAYFALLNWLQRFKSFAPVDSVDSLKAAAHDPQLDLELDSIEQQLFAPNARASRWSSRQLTRRIGLARRTLRRETRETRTTRPLPQRLNPIGEGTGAEQRQRPPAR
jgi:hypothetical protein